jgi:hypothetical protein
MTGLTNTPCKKFPADTAPDDLMSKNFQLFELTKSDLVFLCRSIYINRYLKYLMILARWLTHAPC